MPPHTYIKLPDNAPGSQPTPHCDARGGCSTGKSIDRGGLRQPRTHVQRSEDLKPTGWYGQEEGKKEEGKKGSGLKSIDLVSYLILEMYPLLQPTDFIMDYH